MQGSCVVSEGLVAQERRKFCHRPRRFCHKLRTKPLRRLATQEIIDPAYLPER